MDHTWGPIGLFQGILKSTTTITALDNSSCEGPSQLLQKNREVLGAPVSLLGGPSFPVCLLKL
jgi:hypothetical protein